MHAHLRRLIASFKKHGVARAEIAQMVRDERAALKREDAQRRVMRPHRSPTLTTVPWPPLRHLPAAPDLPLITEEMRRAGFNVLHDLGGIIDGRALVERIFRAMFRAAPKPPAEPCAKLKTERDADPVPPLPWTRSLSPELAAAAERVDAAVREVLANFGPAEAQHEDSPRGPALTELEAARLDLAIAVASTPEPAAEARVARAAKVWMAISGEPACRRECWREELREFVEAVEALP